MLRTRPLLLVTVLTLTACPPTSDDTSATGTTGDTDTTSETSSSATATTSTTSTTTTATTTTTTMGTTTTTTSTTDATTDMTTGVDPACGDGNVDAGEECDNGSDNADNAGCTAACKNAVCGDGLVHEGNEACDDGVNDGAYAGCNPDCSLAPRCGDGVVQAEGGEECDASDPLSACLGSCRLAQSCLEIKADYPDAASGVYSIKPGGQDAMVEVYCDMETDGGGYTFVKVHSSKPKIASEAEAFCATLGMQLFIPRTAAHAAAAFTVATSETVAPVGDGALPTSPKYLGILGIYPVTAGVSCPGLPFNSAECLEWQASDQQVFHVTSDGQAEEPSAKNCAGCSLYYDWTDGATVSYLASNVKGGGSSLAYLCDVGDKLP